MLSLCRFKKYQEARLGKILVLTGRLFDNEISHSAFDESLQNVMIIRRRGDTNAYSPAFITCRV